MKAKKTNTSLLPTMTSVTPDIQADNKSSPIINDNKDDIPIDSTSIINHPDAAAEPLSFTNVDKINTEAEITPLSALNKDAIKTKILNELESLEALTNSHLNGGAKKNRKKKSKKSQRSKERKNNLENIETGRNFRKPFKYGWKRLVYITDNKIRRVNYKSPEGKMVTSFESLGKSKIFDYYYHLKIL